MKNTVLGVHLITNAYNVMRVLIDKLANKQDIVNVLMDIRNIKGNVKNVISIRNNVFKFVQ